MVYKIRLSYQLIQYIQFLAFVFQVLLVVSDANVDENEGRRLETVSQALRDSGILVHAVGVTMEMSLQHLVETATSEVYVWPEVDDEMLKELKKLEKKPC